MRRVCSLFEQLKVQRVKSLLALNDLTIFQYLHRPVVKPDT